MKFKSKVDNHFLIFIGICVAIIITSSLFPIVFKEVREEPIVIVILISICILILVPTLWYTFDLLYILKEKELFIKAGPFRTKIPYEAMTSINPTKDIYTGYRLLTSKDAIAIHYKTGLMGEVKISPAEKEKFIAELQKRAPHISVKGFE